MVLPGNPLAPSEGRGVGLSFQPRSTKRQFGGIMLDGVLHVK